MDFSLSRSVRGVGIPDAAALAIEELQQFIRERAGLGTGGDGSGSFVTAGQLSQWGFATSPNGQSVTLPGGVLDAPDFTPPPVPQGVQAFGGYASVMVRWKPNPDRRIGSAEVWRAATNSLGAAVLIGTTTSNIYVDESQNGNAFFYWVRNVNKWDQNVKSGFNAVSGTAGNTAPDVDYALSVLTGAQGNQPFYTVGTATTIDGVTIAPGVYVKSLFARDAIVRTFRAGLAVIDDANIMSLNAGKITTDSLVAKFATLTVANLETMYADKAFIKTANIQSLSASKIATGTLAVGQEISGGNWYASNGQEGWVINAAGAARFNNVTIKGTVESSVINSPTINGGTITGITFVGDLLRSAHTISYTPTVAPGSAVRGGSFTTWGNYFDLAATGSGVALQIGGKARIYADGRAEFDDIKINSQSDAFYSNLFGDPAAGTLGTWVHPNPNVAAATGSVELPAFVIDTGIDDASFVSNTEWGRSWDARVAVTAIYMEWVAGGPELFHVCTHLCHVTLAVAKGWRGDAAFNGGGRIHLLVRPVINLHGPIKTSSITIRQVRWVLKRQD